ncbi:MAG: hypothetical protein AAFQ87_12640 [Bacteroidota bacterium]
MRFFIIFLLLGSSYTHALAQGNQLQWFVSPEAGAIIHNDHLGRTMGFQTGFRLVNGHLKTGIFFYGRSGPINPQTFVLTLPEGQTYKGKSSLDLRGDHGAFGLFVSPVFSLGEQWQLEVPLMFGQLGAGFYLVGEDRVTPDGRRVSDWEDELMGDTDAGFGWLLEGGVRASRPITPSGNVRAGLGLHYSHTIGYQSFVGGTEFYKRPRVALFVEFGN